MKNLYTVTYYTMQTVGPQKVKVIAKCEEEAIKKVKDWYLVMDITNAKVTKTERVIA